MTDNSGHALIELVKLREPILNGSYMSTIVVAQKNGRVCIGADTMSSLGSLRQRAHHVANHSKITKIDDTFIGLTGTSASLVVMRSYFSDPAKPRDFSSTDGIFETLRYAHQFLKNEYFMSAMPRNEEEYETTQFYGVAANPQGIFALYSYRSCQQFQRFWAAGSGRDFALGAMQVAYEGAKTVEEVVKAGLFAAAEFDGGTAGPYEIHAMDLATTKPRRTATPGAKKKKKS
jgi:ATP-dependent protease HslVU (ClpYQ) peptidase subunit